MVAVFGSGFDKMKKKFCIFCKKYMVEPDPVHPERTRAWHKPRQEGRVCAYCGVAKLKLHPHKDSQAVVLLVDSNPQENKRFFDYIDAMISAYLRGDRAAINIDTEQKQSITKEQEVSMNARVRGKMKLLSEYEFGDPRTNGKGHTVTRAMWKDGVIRDVVLMPTTPADEMEVSWDNRTLHRHQLQLHNGEHMENPNQLSDIFNEIRTGRGANRIVGEAVPLAFPGGVPAGNSSSSSGAGARTDQQLSVGLSKDDEEDEEEQDDPAQAMDMLDLLADGVSPAAKKSDSSASAVVPRRGAKNSAPANAPPPLRGGVAAKPKSKVKAQHGQHAPVAAGAAADKVTEGQLAKIESIISAFETAQKGTIVGYDKKYYKNCKTVIDNLSARVSCSSRALRGKIAEHTKKLELVVKLVKAYKQWVRKAVPMDS